MVEVSMAMCHTLPGHQYMLDRRPMVSAKSGLCEHYQGGNETERGNKHYAEVRLDDKIVQIPFQRRTRVKLRLTLPC